MSKQKSMLIKLPSQGFAFWPVGSGDSTTIAIGDGVFMQVDLRHLACVDEDDEDPRMAVIDHLEKSLPKVGGKPYLSVFVLTHPDEDHCRGFADLLKRVTIGELWHTPRVFREYPRDLCDDAKAFRKEAKRRVAKTIKGGEVRVGDRVRVIGYDDLLKEDDYKGFPADRLTVPGSAITELDGEDCSDRFRTFVHGPFKGDCARERNGTSIALQVTLYKEKVAGRAMLLGDLCYPTVKRIFERSKAADVEWNVFLAPHHCSKSVMYWKGEGDSEETPKQDVLDAIEAAAGSPGYIVASSEVIPASNQSGDNPPHARAKKRYEEIVPDEFLCTQEHPNEETPEPIIFSLGANGLQYQEPQQGRSKKSHTLSNAVVAARGSDEPPTRRVGFGRKR
jgi:beta-lactamase superfamily II metal-dependent hydrolase